MTSLSVWARLPLYKVPFSSFNLADDTGGERSHIITNLFQGPLCVISAWTVEKLISGSVVLTVTERMNVARNLAFLAPFVTTDLSILAICVAISAIATKIVFKKRINHVQTH